MTQSDLISALLQLSNKLSTLATSANDAKVARQLLALSLALLDLARQLRANHITLSTDAINRCGTEVAEAIAAAEGIKNQGGYPSVIVEATEVLASMRISGDYLVSAAQPASLAGARMSGPGGFTPIPPDIDWPRPWPPILWPRPWPPYPWPPRPNPPFPPPPWPWPWDADARWDNITFPGYPR